MPRSPQWMDLHQIWFKGSSRGRNQLCGILSKMSCLESPTLFTMQLLWGYDDDYLICQRESAVMDRLRVSSVYQLSPGEKLKLLTVLIHQLLTTTVARNWIDDCAKKLVSAQRHLKCHQLAEQRRSRDETHFWNRKKLEERYKLLAQQIYPTDDNSLQW